MRLEELIASFGPLSVDEWEYNVPFFAIAGRERDWALSVMCPFIIRFGETVVLDSEINSFDEAESAVAEFNGTSIVSVVAPRDRVDPVFLFDNGASLEIIADTQSEPWGMQIYKGTPKQLIDVMGRMAGATGS